MATFIAIALYNTAKLIFVWKKFKIAPFTRDTGKILALLLFMGVLFYALQFPFHPVLNIILKSVLMLLMYAGVLYRFKISEDIFAYLSSWKRK